MTTTDRKKSFLRELYTNPKIVEYIDAKDIEYDDELLNTHLFPYVRIDGVLQDIGTYIGIKVDYPRVLDNDVYKSYTLTAVIISHFDHLKMKTGDARTDVIADELISMWNRDRDNGFKLELVSDVEDPLNDSYYYRQLIFKSITANSIVNGVKTNG